MYFILEQWQRYNKAYKDVTSSILTVQHGFVLKRRNVTRSKVSSWTHNFMCLTGKDDKRVLTTLIERDELQQASLGIRKLHFPNVDCTTEEFHQTIINAYPKLQGTGGFELLRCKAATRDLELIPSPTCHSLRLLRNSIKSNSSKIYICPIQLDIEMVIKEKDHPPVSHLTACVHILWAIFMQKVIYTGIFFALLNFYILVLLQR